MSLLAQRSQDVAAGVSSIQLEPAKQFSGNGDSCLVSRSLELTSVFHECTPGRRKVVDIFGNDTMTIVEVQV